MRFNLTRFGLSERRSTSFRGLPARVREVTILSDDWDAVMLQRQKCCGHHQSAHLEPFAEHDLPNDMSSTRRLS